jgi:hypothetical protein
MCVVAQRCCYACCPAADNLCCIACEDQRCTSARVLHIMWFSAELHLACVAANVMRTAL